MYQIYQVGPGETLDMIAARINIPVNELKRINGMIDSVISGGYIIIPRGEMNNSYTSYMVKPGDNMYAIARKNNIDIDTLLKYNGLNKDDYIYPNQEIMIPSSRTYITKENDTIKDIMNLNVDMNKLNNLYVKEDQVIEF